MSAVPNARHQMIRAGLTALLLVAGLAHAQPGLGRRPGPGVRAESRSPADLDAWVAGLTSASDSERARLGAATRLVAHASTGDGLALIENLLSTPLSGVGGGRYLLTAIEESPSPAPALAAILDRRAQAAEEYELPRIIRALSVFRSRDAARSIGTFLGHPSAPIRDAAFQAIESLTGATAVGRTQEAWQEWLARADQMSELGWSEFLLDSISVSRRASQSAGIAVKGRLLETLRKLHLETPSDRRSELLVSMLTDTDQDVQRLGFELARRELSVNGALDSSVARAAINLLTSALPAVRADAAVLVRQLGVPEGEDAVLTALRAEADPTVAENLLVASARWPRADAVAPVLKWLEHPTTRAAAAEAAWSMVRTATIHDEDQRRIFKLVDRTDGAALSAAEIQLIGALGQTDDLLRLVPLLDSASGTVQRAAADALVWDSETFGTVVDAAGRHPNLFEAALTAILVHDPTIDGFRHAAALPFASEDLRRERLAGLSRGMTATEVLAASEMLGDPELRRLLLAAMTTDARIASERDRPEALAAISEAIVRQTENDVRAGRHEAGLGRFELFPFVFDSTAGPRASELRCCCLVALGRLTAAVDLICPLECWWRGLEGASGRPHELAIVEMIEADFGEQLSPPERELLTRTRERVTRASRPE